MSIHLERNKQADYVFQKDCFDSSEIMLGLAFIWFEPKLVTTNHKSLNRISVTHALVPSAGS